MVQWDLEKAAVKRAQAGVGFADAATVLTDDLALTVQDNDPDEVRFVTIGMDAIGRLPVVVYAWSSNDVRLISARKATASERRQYENN